MRDPVRRLPDGGKAWFVRVRKRTSYSINPCSIEGWIVTIAFVVISGLGVLAILLTGGRPEQISPIRWFAGAVFLLGMMVAFIAVAARMSAPSDLRNETNRHARRRMGE